MTLVPFDPHADLIFVNAKLWGPLGNELLLLAHDTASTETLIPPENLNGLGYNVLHAARRTRIVSALGAEPGYTIRVERFSSLGFARTDFLVHAHDLGDGADIDGLLGLSFLRKLNYEVRSVEGVLRVELATSPAA